MEAVLYDPSSVYHKAAEVETKYRIGDNGGALQRRSCSFRKYLNRADVRGLCTVPVIDLVHILAATFRIILSRCVLDSDRVLANHSVVLSIAVYR